MDDREPPVQSGWRARIRRWLWLDSNNVRTDKSQANRGFYVGGPPVAWRFILPVVAGGIVIALIILVARDAEAQSADEGQRLVFEKPGFAVTVPADWDVEILDPWEESCGDTVWGNRDFGDARDSGQGCAFMTSQCLSGDTLPFPPRSSELEVPFEWVDLPAGRATYFEDPQLLPLTSAYYHLTRGVKAYVIACHAHEPPEDRWRSIAESFEYLRDEYEVVVPRPGLSMLFPGDWTVLEDRGQAGSPGWAGVLWASNGRSTCRLQYDTRLQDPNDPPTASEIHIAYLTWLKARRGDVTGSTEVDLPIGPARRTDWTVGWVDGEMSHSTFEFDAGDAHVRLICRAEEPPEDRWFSLAQTIAPRPDVE